MSRPFDVKARIREVIKRQQEPDPRPLVEIALDACRAAIRYDLAIQRHADEATLDDQWIDGDDLDALYAAWISASRLALARAHKEVTP